MHPLRKQRLQIVVMIVAASAIASGLLIYILPDLFAENEAAIAAGRLDQNRVLQASEVLAKHDEKYTPPEVAESMNAAYKAKQKRKAEKL